MKNSEEEKEYLIIHRNLPGTHTDGIDCWCDPHIIPEDTLLTPQQIVEMVSKKEFIN
jgi:hypothetical protein